MELGVWDSLPVLNDPAVLNQLQLCFSSGAQTRQPEIGCLEPLAPPATGDHFGDLAGAMPILLDVIWSLIGPQLLSRYTTMTNFVTRCK